MILAEDGECPDQTAQMRRLILAFDVRICPKTFFSHGVAPTKVILSYKQQFHRHE